MIRILTKEFTGFLNSLIAYVVIGTFLTATGLLIWVFPETSIPEYGYADLYGFFTSTPYVLMFLIPAITMRSFAEEKREGTLELLFTKPVTDWQVILGKFFAAWLLVVFALLPTIIYYFSVQQLGDPPGNADTPGIIGSYIGLVLLSGVFSAVGMLASSMSTNQIVSFVLSVFLIFLLFSGLDSVATLLDTHTVEQLGLRYHYDSMSRGVIDSRDLIYFGSMAGFILLITRTVIGSRKWE